ncbi:AAA family ATPase [Sphingomonas sp. 1P06PA]|uniref:ATP-binding protein n=1 Tax=Sphingomonas sp. 1P06PA TaxID=554121 RepID=UPI0039A6F7FB
MSAMHPHPARAALASGIARLVAALAGEHYPMAEVETDPAAPLARMAAMFALSPFERDLILLAVGHQVDRGLAEAIAARAEAADGWPTLALALATLAEPHWSAIAPARPLRRWHLLMPQEGPTLSTAPLIIDERLIHYLLGVDGIDPRLAGIATLDPAPPGPLAAAHADTVARLLNALAGVAPGERLPAILLSGDDRAGLTDTARALAGAFGLVVLVLDADAVPAEPGARVRLTALLDREAALTGAMLLLRAPDALPAPTLRLAEAIHAPLIVATRDAVELDRPSLRAEIDLPGPVERAALWRATLGEARGAEADALALRHRIGAAAIARHGAGDPATLAQDCRSAGRAKVDSLAERIGGGATLDDLVLPPPERASIDAIIAQMRARPQVELGWGAASQGGRGLGVTALFAGESGTGKTMAAEAIAHALGIDLYRVDLSATVSKYIGETEKNLRRLFDAAEDAGAALLFDEADALFGKRGEVREAHDRYANLEVGYLLQRVERFAGLAILTTNLKSAIDPAFLRRLRFVITFPFPDEAARAAIWRRVLPPGMPAGAIDPDRLARLAVAGGAIRTIALNAAFIAADAGRAPVMADMVVAARADAAKRERPLSDAETRGWA